LIAAVASRSMAIQWSEPSVSASAAFRSISDQSVKSWSMRTMCPSLAASTGAPAATGKSTPS